MFKMDVEKGFIFLSVETWKLPQQSWHSSHISYHGVLQFINMGLSLQSIPPIGHQTTYLDNLKGASTKI
jgi:hypothetical protein